MSQTEFAWLIGATRGMVMQYEKRGTRPKNETLSRIVSLTGISKNDLEGELLEGDRLPQINPYAVLALEKHRKSDVNAFDPSYKPGFRKFEEPSKKLDGSFPALDIKVRLLEFLETSNIAPEVFEVNAGLEPGFLTNLQNSIKIADWHKIADAYPDLNGTWLLDGVGAMIINRQKGVTEDKTYSDNPSFQDRLRDIKLKQGRKQIPFFDASAQGGADITHTEMTAISAPSGTIDVGDLLSDSEAAIRVYGNSMIPNYPPGCVVGLSRSNKKIFEPGEVYVIETDDKRMIKRLFWKDDDPESGKIMCYSDNVMKFEGGPRNGMLAYPHFFLSTDDIINLYSVTGVIKRNSNSVIIKR